MLGYDFNTTQQVVSWVSRRDNGMWT